MMTLSRGLKAPQLAKIASVAPTVTVISVAGS